MEKWIDAIQLTYNMILCGIAFPLLAWFIKRLITEQKTELLARFLATDARFERLESCFTKELREVNGKAEKGSDKTREVLAQKPDKQYLEQCLEENRRSHEALWDRIHHHTHDPKTGNVQITS